MTYTLVLYFILAGEYSGLENAPVTESLGDYVTESLCYRAAEKELEKRAYAIGVKGAWVATCRVSK
jgi:hypothetical protein